MSRVEDIKTRAMLEVAAAPISLIPFLVGGSTLLVMFALNNIPVVGLALSVSSVVWGIGSGFYRFFYSKAVYNKVDSILTKEKERDRAKEISDLKRLLDDDDAPLLDDIIDLQNLLQSTTTDSISSGELTAMAMNLLEQSITSLKRIPVLDKTLGVTLGKTTKELIRKQRSAIISSTKTNLESVAKVIADIQVSGSNNASNEASTRVLLEERLESAKSIEKQFEAMGLNLGAVQVSN